MAFIIPNLFPRWRLTQIILRRRFPYLFNKCVWIIFICILLVYGLHLLIDFDDEDDYENSGDIVENHILKDSKDFKTNPILDNQIFQIPIFHSLKKRRSRTGPGEMGQPVYLIGSEAELSDELFPKESFNIIASDKISLERSVPDFRLKECLDIEYDQDLPSTSVIIIFHNEAWSTLMRTVHSVYNRSPPHLLHEIILVDDYSYREDVRDKIDHYVETHFNGKVKIIKLKERFGLVRARLAGAKKATGEVLVFLDSHCEASDGWLEPLLVRIKADPTTVVTPTIDTIKKDTMEIEKSLDVSVGIFDWKLTFHWKDYDMRLDDHRKHPTKAMKTPVMAGGLFAIDRKYFWDIGSYDEQMDIWGGENLEMSFRVWMCGGSIKIIPCSRVAHLFRSKSPYTYPDQKETYMPNIFRVVEVWLDEYKDLFYRFHLLQKNKIKYGNITSRVALRKKLKCHSFKWYLKNVYPEMFIYNENVFAWGSVKSGIYCFDTMGKRGVIDLHLYNCQKTSYNQMFSYTKNRRIRKEDSCLSSTGKANAIVQLVNCLDNKANQEWNHMESGAVIHAASKKCVDREDIKFKEKLRLRKCNGKSTQKWKFTVYMDGMDS